jgi:CHAD domain-containing protein
MTKAKASYEFDPHAEYREAMRVLIGERWVKVWETIPDAIAGDDIEGVHQVRVASRHLRAAMDVAVGCFPDKWYRPLHKTAKEITGALGGVRDLDVLHEAFVARRRKTRVADRAGIDFLIAQIEADRIVARERMETYLTKLEKSGVRKESAKRFPVPAEVVHSDDESDGQDDE